MTKRFISLLLAASMVLALALCGCSSSSKETERKKRKSKKTEKTKITETIDDDDDDGKKSTRKNKDDDKKPTDDDKKNTQDDGTPKIGISMPTKALMRWNMDGDRLKNLLVTEGYLVDLQYADNDTSTQIAQIDFLIDSARVTMPETPKPVSSARS